jgi:hypothetical protein
VLGKACALEEQAASVAVGAEEQCRIDERWEESGGRLCTSSRGHVPHAAEPSSRSQITEC